ncbi:MAG TPA: glycosyltransferase [Acidimicrobiia bacterium]|nr:glycosyltransferase [Acidimicrobiia bacterium]
MARVSEVHVQALSPARFGTLIGEQRTARFEIFAEAVHQFLAGRTVLNVNSTATGGGVAEMLQTMLAYARGVGVDARWAVIGGNPAFFEVTKRIHNNLYGDPGDRGTLGDAARTVYEETLRANADDLLALVRPGDFVVLHDPQTAGLVAPVRQAGATVVWRCHVGLDTPNEHSEAAWSFLRPYLEDVDALVFTRRAFAPPWAADDRLHVIAPSIDPFSTKNHPIAPDQVDCVLTYAGLVAGHDGHVPAPFTHRDGSPGRVERHADVLQTGPPPPPDVPLVVQVSRWDRNKDMQGVMAGFADPVDGTADAHLVLAGPAVTGVADDPEGGAVLDDCMAAWRALPHAARARVHLACLPMHDPDENATIVNALQRHAAVVVQKSLAEGFGLTVVEAMWKGRPVVASAVGGIVDQIVDGEHGLLLDDPTDLAGFGSCVRRLLEDQPFADSLGAHAHRRANEEFLGDRHLEEWGKLFAELEGARSL